MHVDVPSHTVYDSKVSVLFLLHVHTVVIDFSAFEDRIFVYCNSEL